MKKEHAVQVLLGTAEYEQLKAAAKHEERSVSNFTRLIILSHLAKIYRLRELATKEELETMQPILLKQQRIDNKKNM